MAAVAKLEAGVIELRTDVGRLYVCPSYWQRIYLRWTFRNFHSLPQQVLNGRQKRLLDALIRTAVISNSDHIPAEAILGIVENVRVLPLPSPALPVETVKPVQPATPEIRVSVMQGKAEAAAAAAEARSAAKAQTQSPFAALDPVPASVLPTDEADPVVPPQQLFAGGRKQRKGVWALATVASAAALLVAVQAALLWRAPQMETAPPVVKAPAAAYSLEQKQVADRVRVTAIHNAKQAFASTAGSPALLSHRVGAAPGEAKAVAPALSGNGSSGLSNPTSLPQIAEAPASGFVYPVAPNPNLVGKVVLKAVIGSDGAVKQVDILSGDHALAAAAARAVRHWRYAPLQVDGHAAEAQTQVTVSFLGDDAVSVILPQPR